MLCYSGSWANDVGAFERRELTFTTQIGRESNGERGGRLKGLWRLVVHGERAVLAGRRVALANLPRSWCVGASCRNVSAGRIRLP